MIKKIYILLFLAFSAITAFAGNPDRQGEAGAGHLLMTPWARTAGLHTLNTSHISGVEAMRLNPAGVGRINSTQISAGYTSYFSGTDINISSIGIAQRFGENSSFGISLMSVDLGDFIETTELQPEGTGATFSPNLFNIGLTYSYVFENKISVGATFRGVSEAISDATAFGFAIDAGVQYVTGEEDNFRFGISLRNIGSRLTYKGQGLSETLNSPTGAFDDYPLTFFQRAQSFELPSMLNIGMGYDFYFGDDVKLTALGNFTANSFSQDQLGAGLEFGFRELFELRAAYKYEVGSEEEDTAPIYTGLAGGFSVYLPLSKEKKNNRIRLDYAYRDTKLWDGTHNITLSLDL
ncbi:MAG: PorV/PorQ family protein [Saprospiraceae bacterium]|nr:PorV/PorQ family protein [Saprospiraceae bacterium]